MLTSIWIELFSFSSNQTLLKPSNYILYSWLHDDIDNAASKLQFNSSNIFTLSLLNQCHLPVNKPTKHIKISNSKFLFPYPLSASYPFHAFCSCVHYNQLSVYKTEKCKKYNTYRRCQILAARSRTEWVALPLSTAKQSCIDHACSNVNSTICLLLITLPIPMFIFFFHPL